jgi:hypothetical protein
VVCDVGVARDEEERSVARRASISVYRECLLVCV